MKRSFRHAVARGTGLSVFAIAAICPAGPAGAQSAEDAFVRYHSAIYAADLCTDYRFEQVGEDDEDAAWIGRAQDNMGNYINVQVGNAIGAGDRLHLIERAKGETDAYVGDHGCEDPKTVELLAIFTNELEPLLPPR
jgi:hypothetical protein